MKDWTTIYETPSIADLKNLGHKLLNEYIMLDEKRKGRNAVEHAYKKLGTKLNSMYGMHHFGKMKNRKEVVNAIVRLRRMIDARKNNNQWKRDKVCRSPRRKKHTQTHLDSSAGGKKCKWTPGFLFLRPHHPS